MKRKLATFLAIIMALCMPVTALAGSFSPKWRQSADGNWQAVNGGVLCVNTWIFDNECDVAEGLYYLAGPDGNLVASPLVLDGEGRYYCFSNVHDGHYGHLITESGVVYGVKLTFSALHDGSFGSITNPEGIAAMKAKYGVTELPSVNNSRCVRLSDVRAYDNTEDDPGCLVSFDLDGVNVTEPGKYRNRYYEEGTSLAKPATPSAVNGRAIFTGWYLEGEDEPFDFEDFAVNGDISFKAGWIKNYLTFTALEEGSTVTFKYKTGTDVAYSFDGGVNWNDCKGPDDPDGDLFLLQEVGDSVCFSGKNVTTFVDKDEEELWGFSMTGSIAASGDVTSLTNGAGGDAVLSKECYTYMFYDCDALVTAPALPSTKLADGCYSDMFSGCDNLTEAPELPALIMKKSCYEGMFESSGLTEAPELPSTMLAESCYESMFCGCNELTEAPVLLATEMEKYCYLNMFNDCYSLVSAPTLPAITLAEGCYKGMFHWCTGLSELPELPAMVLAKSCYQGMFTHCISLTKLPDLPATTLAEDCYKQMFQINLNLKVYESDGEGRTEWKIPGEAVPATGWNRGMFYGTTGEFTGDPVIGTSYYYLISLD